MKITDPFTMIYTTLWDLINANDRLMELIRLRNRIDYSGDYRNPEKDTLSSADLPELRLVPSGGAAHLRRTTHSTSITRRFAFQLHSGSRRLHKMLFPIEWELFCCLAQWPEYIGKLLWNGEKFAVRMSTIDITEEMFRPTPEGGGSQLGGWLTVWVGEIECFFPTDKMRFE